MSVLLEEATDTYEKKSGRGIIQNEQFSEPDSDQESIESGENLIQSDYWSLVPRLITSQKNRAIL